MAVFERIKKKKKKFWNTGKKFNVGLISGEKRRLKVGYLILLKKNFSAF
jgi:hypothetical protein